MIYTPKKRWPNPPNFQFGDLHDFPSARTSTITPPRSASPVKSVWSPHPAGGINENKEGNNGKKSDPSGELEENQHDVGLQFVQEIPTKKHQKWHTI